MKSMRNMCEAAVNKNLMSYEIQIYNVITFLGTINPLIN